MLCSARLCLTLLFLAPAAAAPVCALALQFSAVSVAAAQGVKASGSGAPATAAAPRAQAMEAEAKAAVPAAVACLISAFNAHDPGAMGRCVDRQIEVYYVDTSGAAALGTAGRSALVEEMKSYFTSVPGVRSSLSGAQRVGRYVSAAERVHWTSAAGDERTQVSVTVYELHTSAEGEVVRRVWYYPAQP